MLGHACTQRALYETFLFTWALLTIAACNNPSPTSTSYTSVVRTHPHHMAHVLHTLHHTTTETHQQEQASKQAQRCRHKHQPGINMDTDINPNTNMPTFVRREWWQVPAMNSELNRSKATINRCSETCLPPVGRPNHDQPYPRHVVGCEGSPPAGGRRSVWVCVPRCCHSLRMPSKSRYHYVRKVASEPNSIQSHNV